MADTVVWSVPAMCMVPTAETAREQKYVTTAGRIKFSIGETGQIAFMAPVESPFPLARYHLRAHVLRRVPDLSGTSIQLRRASRSSGQVSTVLNCVGVQGGTVPDNIRASDSVEKKMAIDLDNYFYWVQVTDKNVSPATAESVDAVLGVSLIRINV